MELSLLERGTKLKVYEELQQRAISDEYEAVFRYHESDKLIVVQCAWLYENYDKLSLGARLNLSYSDEVNEYAFIGLAKEKLRGHGLVMIEQLTDVETTSRRQFNRDELRVNVNVYGLPESKITATVFEVPASAPELRRLIRYKLGRYLRCYKHFAEFKIRSLLSCRFLSYGKGQIHLTDKAGTQVKLSAH